VAIVNVDRNRDYTPTYAPRQLGSLEFPTSGGATQFLEFMESELIPYIDSHYRTEPYRILCGWSLGGLFTIYSYLEQITCFSAYLAISPSLWWDEDAYFKKAKEFVKRNDVLQKRLVVTVGSEEGGNIGRTVKDGVIPLMKNKYGRGGRFRSAVISGEGHNYVPYKAIYEGLISLFSDWVVPNGSLEKGFPDVEEYYQNLSREYGYAIKIPAAAFSKLMDYVFNQVSTNAAMEIAQQYVRLTLIHPMRTSDVADIMNF
jgi:hypothetical protein